MNAKKTRTPSMTLLDVEAALRQREMKGLASYGQTVDRTDFSALEWAHEGLQEALDGALYCMRTVKAIERLETRAEVMMEALSQIATHPMQEADMKNTAKIALRLLKSMDGEQGGKEVE